MAPLFHGQTVTAPETSRITYGTNQGTNEDDSQSVLHPGESIPQSQTNLGLEDAHDMVTRFHVDLTYCSPSTSLSKQKKTALPVNRNSAMKTSLRRLKQIKFFRHYRGWQTTTILQIFITTTIEYPSCQSRSAPRCQRLTADQRSLSCFKNSFRTSLKIHNQLHEDDIYSFFQYLISSFTLQTFKNINCPTREIYLGKILAVSRRKYVKPQMVATTKQKLQKTDFNPAK